jgi:pimeloyl-ACP methyl ester carboxylesterase
MKILMLHGYAQTGDTFRRKLCRLEASLRQLDAESEFVYLDGPIKLETHDIPGSTATYHHEGEHDMRAWFDLRIVRNPPTGIYRSLDLLAATLKSEGPFDGIVAFSQGTVVGAMVASLLQGNVRRRAYEAALEQSNTIFDYPESFLDIRHPLLKFALFYASRVGTGDYSGWMYQHPRIATPFCHFYGEWDPMVSYEERDAVLERVRGDEEAIVVAHGGGHFVPTDCRSIETACDFVRRCMLDTGKVSRKDSGVGLKL